MIRIDAMMTMDITNAAEHLKSLSRKEARLILPLLPQTLPPIADRQLVPVFALSSGD